MAGYQQIIIIGNVGREPELKYTQAGIPLCSFSVAVTEKWTQDGEKREKVTWYRVTAWRNLAEICDMYVTKGMQIMVSGSSIEASAYMNKNNEPAASLELTAKDVQFLGSVNTNSDTQDMADMPF